MSDLADLDRDDLDALADWLDARRKSKSERKAQDDLRQKIDDLAGKGLSDADVERIAEAVTRRAGGTDGGDGAAGADGQGAGEGGGSDGDAGGDTPNPPPKPRTRPGRKSGSVYDWDVDDQGQVVKLDTAKVYGGDDEPESVELPDPPAAD